MRRSTDSAGPADATTDGAVATGLGAAAERAEAGAVRAAAAVVAAVPAEAAATATAATATAATAMAATGSRRGERCRPAAPGGRCSARRARRAIRGASVAAGVPPVGARAPVEDAGRAADEAPAAGGVPAAAAAPELRVGPGKSAASMTLHHHALSASRSAPLAGALLALSLVAAPAGAQLLGSPQKDVDQGAEVARLVEQQIGLYEAPEAEALLRRLGERLAAAAGDSRWKFTFRISDEAEPNAFAIPGGGIYVSRGLLALVESEDELAGILAHEIAHVTERHSAKQQRKGFLPSLLTLPGNLVGGLLSENLGALINAPIDTLGGAWLSRYSRSQETDADRIGVRTAAAAGYDPQALGTILHRLERDVESRTGRERKASLFDSHPMTETRLAEMKQSASTVTPAKSAPLLPDRAALLATFDGTWWGANPANGLLQEDEFRHPVLGITLTLPAGWKHRNLPEFLVSEHPRQEATLLLGVAGPAADPAATGKAFVEKMRREAKVEPESMRAASLGDLPAFVVTYLDRSGRTPTYLHFLWTVAKGKTFQLVGMSPEKHRGALRNSALSLRPLTDTERASISGKRLRIVTARQGERLEELSARSGNAWSPDYTALVNGLEPDAELKDGQAIKTVRVELVRP